MTPTEAIQAYRASGTTSRTRDRSLLLRYREGQAGSVRRFRSALYSAFVDTRYANYTVDPIRWLGVVAKQRHEARCFAWQSPECRRMLVGLLGFGRHVDGSANALTAAVGIATVGSIIAKVIDVAGAARTGDVKRVELASGELVRVLALNEILAGEDVDSWRINQAYDKNWTDR